MHEKPVALTVHLSSSVCAIALALRVPRLEAALSERQCVLLPWGWRERLGVLAGLHQCPPVGILPPCPSVYAEGGPEGAPKGHEQPLMRFLLLAYGYHTPIAGASVPPTFFTFGLQHPNWRNTIQGALTRGCSVSATPSHRVSVG